MNTIKKLNNVEEYNSFLENNNHAVVKISSAWCGPCKTLERTIINLDLNKINETSFGEIDVDNEEFENLLSELNIRGIPVMIYYNNGQEVSRSVGLVGTEDIYNKLSTL